MFTRCVCVAQTVGLRQELARKERQLDELKQKYTKHKHILTENVQKAESEIQTLDEIIDYVIVVSGPGDASVIC